jgi:hypothetical protein
MSVAALMAATVFQLGSAHSGVAVDGGLVYLSDAHRRTVIRRLDLETGERTLLYTAPDPRTPIVDLQAGGGTVVFQLAGSVKRVYRMSARGEGREQLFAPRDYVRDCGRVIRLRDVSRSGTLLYEDVTVPCRTRRGRYRLRTLDSANHGHTLTRRPARSLFLSDGVPFHQLSGEQLVTWGDGIVRVRDLSTGRVRRFRPADRLSDFSEPDVAADGRVLLSEFRHMGRGRFPRQTIRLVSASGKSTVVHRRQRVYGDARFCGDRPVLKTFDQRGRLRLSLLAPLVPLFDGRHERDVEASCDTGHFVLVTIGHDPGELAWVHPLPQHELPE